ncbi:hypothetical protein QLQ85_14130 [Halomonas sp. M4R5S39]|uniref:hypothetical protein n=1 Tax=Halomonas kalidii TaxID=3043293 RepID=UPI0024A81881|nr:hypothetical protein [Halomonas kalidii]MDI5985931.1 hypothetical protein [Halomonas kalidii]
MPTITPMGHPAFTERSLDACIEVVVVQGIGSPAELVGVDLEYIVTLFKALLDDELPTASMGPGNDVAITITQDGFQAT